ncbi:MAG: hypothetical protein U0790_11865 [Isosphaeraceae bacterium]
MSCSTPTDAPLEPKLEALLAEVSLEVFGPEEEALKLDFATIERRAHEVGRRVARRLAEEAAARQALALDGPQPCPDCERPCERSTTALETRTGLALREAGVLLLAMPASPFSPNRVMQRLDHRRYSPAVLTKAVCTATAARSFEEAAKVLRIVASLEISPRHLQTLCGQVGDELRAPGARLVAGPAFLRTAPEHARPGRGPAGSPWPSMWSTAAACRSAGRAGPWVHEAASPREQDGLLPADDPRAGRPRPHPQRPPRAAHPRRGAAGSGPRGRA